MFGNRRNEKAYVTLMIAMIVSIVMTIMSKGCSEDRDKWMRSERRS